MKSRMHAYVLLSGGLDSTTALYMAQRDNDTTTALLVFYDQRHRVELDYALATCSRLGIKCRTLNLSAVIPPTLLTDENAELPDKSYADIEGVSPAFVPFRNGLMLSAAAAQIVSDEADLGAEEGAAYLYFGAHAEDAHNWAYPDCTAEFMGAMANALYVGTYQKVRLIVPFQHMTKAQIIGIGSHLGVDYKLTWSCYAGGAVHCGKCPTCRARRDAFIVAGIADPTEYATANPNVGDAAA